MEARSRTGAAAATCRLVQGMLFAFSIDRYPQASQMRASRLLFGVLGLGKGLGERRQLGYTRREEEIHAAIIGERSHLFLLFRGPHPLARIVLVLCCCWLGRPAGPGRLLPAAAAQQATARGM